MRWAYSLAEIAMIYKELEEAEEYFLQVVYDDTLKEVDYLDKAVKVFEKPTFPSLELASYLKDKENLSLSDFPVMNKTKLNERYNDFLVHYYDDKKTHKITLVC